MNVLSAEQLNYVLSFTRTATAVHVGEQARIEFANEAMLSIWGNGREVIGKGLAEAMPELEGQPFLNMFARVWREGITLRGSDTAAELLADGELTTFYFDFEYRAVKDEGGRVVGVVHTATDVTERVLNGKELQEAIHNKELLLTLSEDLGPPN